MRRFEASPRRATPKGHTTFINCTAPPSPGPTYTTQAPAFVAHSRSPFSRLVRTKTPHGYISHQSRGTSPENMNLQVNEPTRRPGQPLCQDPWIAASTVSLLDFTIPSILTHPRREAACPQLQTARSNGQGCWLGVHHVSGGRGESHPPAPTDPGVRVSRHRALVILILRTRRSRPTGRKASGADGLSAASTPWPSGTPAAVDTSCGAGASSSH